jgi:hypothetical protein
MRSSQKEFGRHVFDRMTIVARGVAHECERGPELLFELGDGCLQGRDIAQIAVDEGRAGLGRQRLASRLVEVEEANARALRGEVLDDRGADAGRAAGHDHGLVLEARIGGEGTHAFVAGSLAAASEALHATALGFKLPIQ